MIFERGGPPSLDFIAKLVALVPKARVKLTRFHGVLARGGHPPNSKFRVRVMPARSPDEMEQLSLHAEVNHTMSLMGPSRPSPPGLARMAVDEKSCR